MSDKHLKKLVAEIPISLHTEIKRRALFHNISLRKWIIQAIAEKIKKEDVYQ